ncbi:hypothetical protein HGP28_02280 [Vibrio sp. SM6]|uniref:Uncharacterized protein n=1 Tax=Vibrio agarilyticus TaxID=2726741 RepID=A0A7X8TNA5_9VIBR|nr:hypothetical protein [Vibrio agarilyticus]
MLLMLSFSVQAEYTKDDESICVAGRTAAGLIMHYRQQGESAQDLFDYFGSVDVPKSVKSIYIKLVEQAYKLPKVSNLEYKEMAISQFEERTYALCKEQRSK